MLAAVTLKNPERGRERQLGPAPPTPSVSETLLLYFLDPEIRFRHGKRLG